MSNATDTPTTPRQRLEACQRRIDDVNQSIRTAEERLESLRGSHAAAIRADAVGGEPYPSAARRDREGEIRDTETFLSTIRVELEALQGALPELEAAEARQRFDEHRLTIAEIVKEAAHEAEMAHEALNAFLGACHALYKLEQDHVSAANVRTKFADRAELSTDERRYTDIETFPIQFNRLLEIAHTWSTQNSIRLQLDGKQEFPIKPSTVGLRLAESGELKT